MAILLKLGLYSAIPCRVYLVYMTSFITMNTPSDHKLSKFGYLKFKFSELNLR